MDNPALAKSLPKCTNTNQPALIVTAERSVATGQPLRLLRRTYMTWRFPRSDFGKHEKANLMFDANHPSQLLPGTQLSFDLPSQNAKRQATAADQFARRLEGLRLLRELTQALGEQRAAIDLADFRKRLVSDR